MATLYETGFEERFAYFGGVSELEVPPGWVPLWVQGTEPGINPRPEWKPETQRVRTGKQSAKWFTTHASHDAVLARTLPVDGRGTVTLVAWGATFEIKAGQALRVGIDPTGQGRFPDERIVWGDWWGQYNGDWEAEKYHRFEVSVPPESNQIAVYLHSRSDYKAQTVACYWDDVTVEQVGGTEPGEPGEGVDYARIRQIVREELDATRLGSG